MKKIRNHIEDLFRDVPKTEQAEIVKQEIIQNLEEKVMYLMDNDKEEEDAINKAIVEFGDIEELKKELGVKKLDSKKANLAKLNLTYSIWGSGLLIAFTLFINFYYTPQTIWFVYPMFGLIWWPLSMYFYWQRKK